MYYYIIRMFIVRVQVSHIYIYICIQVFIHIHIHILIYIHIFIHASCVHMRIIYVQRRRSRFVPLFIDSKCGFMHNTLVLVWIYKKKKKKKEKESCVHIFIALVIRKKICRKFIDCRFLRIQNETRRNNCNKQSQSSMQCRVFV